jgi:hypothetical protein
MAQTTRAASTQVAAGIMYQLMDGQAWDVVMVGLSSLVSSSLASLS